MMAARTLFRLRSAGWPGIALAVGGALFSVAILAGGESEEPKETGKSLIGRRVADFILPDARGRRVALSDHRDRQAVVIFFMGTGCPIANLYLTELGDLRRRYERKGLEIIGINSNAGVNPEKLAEHAREYRVTLPVLLDRDQRVADALGATRMAEVFLLDRQRVIRYHGRVDDRFGYTHKREEPRRRDLVEAIDEVLAGKPVSVPETEALGCLITHSDRPQLAGKVTYAREVSRIIQRRCHECHRPGMIGPFSLMTYEDAVEWSAMMKEVVLQRRMPPWHADPRYGHFSNNRRMPREEVDTLVAWIDSGTPFGDRKDLPPPPEYAEGWVIDRPDIVFELPEEVTVPADGVVPYLYFKVPTNFKEDVWIQAAEALPGNRSVVHHIIVFCRDPKNPGVRRRGELLVGTAPGDPPMILPPGVAKKVPAGAELIFQMHYTPTGKVKKDRSRVGLIRYRGEGPPRSIARTQSILNLAFEIPPGAAHHRVDSTFTFGRDARILSFMPHMHLRGKDFTYRATYPDGRSEILLSVPEYDFNWQNKYRFTKPVETPRGTRIDCTAHFDNSAGNPANPDPTRAVRWGDQTWEEMMIGWMTYVWKEADVSSPAPRRRF